MPESVMAAVKGGDVAQVTTDISADPSLLHRTDKDGTSLLVAAALKSRVALVELLLDRGAEKDKPNAKGFTPLNIASLTGNAALAELLLKRGAGKNKASLTGYTPLHSAAISGHLAVVQLLLDRKAAKDKPMKDGRTPLHLAAQNGRLPVVQLLLDRGADKDKLASGWTPLFLASEKGHASVVQLLLDRGADKDKATDQGWTPLMNAAENNHLEVVQVLLRHQAQGDLKDKDGRTALDRARDKGHTKMVDLLTPQVGDLTLFGSLEQSPDPNQILTLSLISELKVDLPSSDLSFHPTPDSAANRCPNSRPDGVRGIEGLLSGVRGAASRGGCKGRRFRLPASVGRSGMSSVYVFRVEIGRAE